MAKSLTISLGNSSFELTPQKVDRDKLYGHTELQVFTVEGQSCCQASINSDGINIICPGATKIGITDENGNWIDRQTLIPISDNGVVPQWMPSSFDNDILLSNEATVEQLLDLNIQSVYQLSGIDTLRLANELNDHIYTFKFSYRGGYESNDAFIIANENGIFMLTGVMGNYEYLGLEEAGQLDNPDEDINIEAGQLDFSMM